MSVTGQSDAKLRQNLEEVISTLRKHNAVLEADVEKASSEALECRTRTILVRRCYSFYSRSGTDLIELILHRYSSCSACWGDHLQTSLSL